MNFLFPAPNARSERRGGGSHRGSRGGAGTPVGTFARSLGGWHSASDRPLCVFLFLLFFLFLLLFLAPFFHHKGGGG